MFRARSRSRERIISMAVQSELHKLPQDERRQIQALRQHVEDTYRITCPTWRLDSHHARDSRWAWLWQIPMRLSFFKVNWKQLQIGSRTSTKRRLWWLRQWWWRSMHFFMNWPNDQMDHVIPCQELKILIWFFVCGLYFNFNTRDLELFHRCDIVLFFFLFLITLGSSEPWSSGKGLLWDLFLPLDRVFLFCPRGIGHQMIAMAWYGYIEAIAISRQKAHWCIDEFTVPDSVQGFLWFIIPDTHVRNDDLGHFFHVSSETSSL